MARSHNPWLWGGLLVFGALCGCDVATMSYFLMPEPRQPAQLKALAQEGKKVKVVLLADTGLETRPEFYQMDLELCSRLGKQLEQLFEENEEDVEIVPQRKVEQFKSSHPAWREHFDPADVGKHFNADTVVYIEVGRVSLYQKGSGNTMFKGQADLALSVIDVHKPESVPERKRFSSVYPSDARGAVPVGDTHPMEFRQHFLDHLARQLSWNFAAYRKRDTYFVE